MPPVFKWRFEMRIWSNFNIIFGLLTGKEYNEVLPHDNERCPNKSKLCQKLCLRVNQFNILFKTVESTILISKIHHFSIYFWQWNWYGIIFEDYYSSLYTSLSHKFLRHAQSSNFRLYIIHFCRISVRISPMHVLNVNYLSSESGDGKE